MSVAQRLQERVLVLMPTSKDAQRTLDALADCKIHCVACANLPALCDEIRRDAGAALLTEGVLLADKSNCLVTTVNAEPPWSDFPLIVLTRQGNSAHSLPRMPALNVTLVERPVRFVTLRSVVEASLRHRRHQYEVRDTLLHLTQAQAELAQANRDLERRVEERTRKLQEMFTELEAFSYTVSHDLRAPLRSLHGYAVELLRAYGNSIDDRGKFFLGKICKSAERMDLMVRDVLAYSRIAQGHVPLQNVDVESIIRDVVEIYPQLREKGAIRIEGPLPEVRAHPAYLTQCVSNLLGNAVKFVRPGLKPEIRIWAEEGIDGLVDKWRDAGEAQQSNPQPCTLNHQPSTEQVRLFFQDNGIGIAEEHFTDIFEIFGRARGAERYEGTGIGLAIVRKAVERMGGSVGLTSELGNGTRFWLSLSRAT